MSPSEMHLKWWFTASEHGYVAGAGDVELTKTISRRDAQLIAAAPELLRLSVDLIVALKGHTLPDQARKAVNRLESTVTKATGETK